MVTHDSEHDFLCWALKGDMEAVSFCEHLFYQTQLIDDLVDRDKAYSNGQVYELVFTLLVLLPRNAFFRQFAPELTSFMATALVNWQCANGIESRIRDDSLTETELKVAFVIRDDIYNIVTHCATLLYGYEWAGEVAPVLRKRMHDETYMEYVGELRKGGAA